MWDILLPRNILGDQRPNPVGLELGVYVTTCNICPQILSRIWYAERVGSGRVWLNR
jgi:hypothetical protein